MSNKSIPKAHEKLSKEQIAYLQSLGPLRRGVFRYHSHVEANAHWEEFEERMGAEGIPERARDSRAF